MKAFGGLFNSPEWVRDLLLKRRKVSCADDSYLENNGPWPKAFKKILETIGNGYSGDK